MNNHFLYKIISAVVFVALVTSVYLYFLKPEAQKEIKKDIPVTNNVIATSSLVSTNTTTTNPTKEISKPVPVPPVVEEKLPIGTDRFVVYLNATTSENVASSLSDQEFIKDQKAFISAIGSKQIAPGAYKLSKTMSVSQITKTILGKPYMKWVVVPEGLRKEEIANLLQTDLSWSAKQKTAFLKATETKPEYIEGVYFPDTYLIPIDEAPADVANRFISKFNEKFGVYLPEFGAQNIKWTSALTLASIVQRELSNDADAPLIAGILWNRLNQGVALGVDATLQYARGNTGSGWWAPIKVADKQIDSPYNTYKNKGLPPHPISNPGIPAIEAVLNPAKTDCLYYLHDKNHVTHCAVTYEEHQGNVEKYLK